MMLDRKPTDIEAVKDQTKQGHDRANQQGVGAGAILFEREIDDREDHTDENLSPEEHAHDATGEEKAEFACYHQLTKLQNEVYTQSIRQGFGKFRKQMDLQATLEIT